MHFREIAIPKWGAAAGGILLMCWTICDVGICKCSTDCLVNLPDQTSSDDFRVGVFSFFTHRFILDGRQHKPQNNTTHPRVSGFYLNRGEQVCYATSMQQRHAKTSDLVWKRFSFTSSQYEMCLWLRFQRNTYLTDRADQRRLQNIFSRGVRK